jgi:hypothetical protein
MSDDPFAAFKEATPPAAGDPSEAGKKKRGPKPGTKRKIPPKKTAEEELLAAQTSNPPAAGKTKKPRQRRAAKEMRLPISMLLEISSLSEEESGALLSIGAGLQKLPKESRGKIVVALGKIFG